MKLGIMQPYFVPYIGYFQLIHAVDRFVIHDDAQWIKGGWLNRNRILVNDEPCYVTLPIKKDAFSLNINQREFAPDIEQHKTRIVRQLEAAYNKAPHIDAVLELVQNCFGSGETHVSRFLTHLWRETCKYLSIDTPIELSSSLTGLDDLLGEQRVLEINRILGSNHYINPIGGRELYDQDHFGQRGLQLSFLEARETPYRQRGATSFVPFLSILDVMMFNSPDEIAVLLTEYDLRTG